MNGLPVVRGQYKARDGRGQRHFVEKKHDRRTDIGVVARYVDRYTSRTVEPPKSLF
jgi:hypothetical protein